MAKDNLITVKFKAAGAPELRRQIESLAKAQAKLNTTSGESTKKGKALGNNMRNNTKAASILGGHIAVLRSQLLVMSFAMSMGTRQLIQFAKEASKVENMSRAFETLSGGLAKSTQGLEMITEATNGAMSEFDLLQQANNALVLGITDNNEEMAEMFNMAQRLGRALGRDTRSSVESLVTGIGRQSRLMLDNIGIVVKADKAYAKYALQLGVSSESLTENQKKQAFLNATLDAAREKVSRLPDEIRSSQDSFDEFASSMENLQVRIGNVVLEALVPLMDGLSSIADSFREPGIKEFLRHIRNLAIAMGGYVVAAKAAVLFTSKLLQAKFIFAGIGVAASFLVEKILGLVGAYDEQHESLEPLVRVTDAYADSLNKLTLAQLHNELVKVQTQMDDLRLVAENPVDMAILAATIPGIEVPEVENEPVDDLTQALKDMVTEYNRAHGLIDEKVNPAFKEQHDRLKEQEESILANIEAHKGYSESMEVMIEKEDEMAALFAKTAEGRAANLTSKIKEIETNDMLFKSEEEQIAVLKMLEKQLESTGQTWTSQASKIGGAIGKMSKDFVTLAAGNKEATIAALQLAKAEGIVNIVVGATKAVKAKGLLGFIEGLALISQGAVMIQQINSQIDAAKKMEQGGLVGGKRHSQGGTLIEAERGEFVMSRNATESIGIENLNRMNRTGSGAGVNINFSGNVLSRDFIEDEAVPLIKDALRKGGDLGIA